MATRRAELEAAGFVGFVRFIDLPASRVPPGPGVYVIVRDGLRAPEFRPTSPAGWFRGKDPTVPDAKLQAAWVEEVEVVYVGKATGGRGGRRGSASGWRSTDATGPARPSATGAGDTSGSSRTPPTFSSRGERRSRRIRGTWRRNSSLRFATGRDHSRLRTSIRGVDADGVRRARVEHRRLCATLGDGCFEPSRCSRALLECGLEPLHAPLWSA